MTASNPPFSAAAERNKQPILDVLLQQLPASGRALEIAAGTGQHAVWFASALPQWQWLPTDQDPAALPGIAAQARQAGCRNLSEPRALDVLAPAWPTPDAVFTEPFDLVYCANMVHIAPWACCGALMQGAGRHLAPSGRLVLYGPFFESGVDPAPGNRDFDRSLRTRNPQWGIRQLDEVDAQARQAGLQLLSRHPMPANNLMLVWGRTDA